MAKPQPNTLGEHLKNCRLERHLFQTDVAKLLCVDRGTIQNWERGIGKPAIHQVPRIIKFLGFDPEPAPATAPQTIVYARRSLGLTQEEFAETLSVAPFSIWQWESGRSVPPEPILKQIRSVLKRLQLSAVTRR
ncbi:MAG: helix-turn-helix domain-containing protein [Verrucomicrobia bacterium]|nr:helix-turn-helix domain-containing protein [Verrucomicrobiota bacterium]